ncbi:MAG: hypothetical protein JRJ62_00270 [Deltaproteobacteria bacterium]|nr:hypothetical protein [Deltaproteobacteria bacterium]
MSRNIFYHVDGQPSPLPTDIEEAKRYRKRNYFDVAACPTCIERGDVGLFTKARFTSNSECCHCALIDALDFYNLAINVYTFDLQNDGSMLIYSDRDGSERPVSNEYFKRFQTSLNLFGEESAPVNRQSAIAHDLGFFVHPEPCKKSGHFGIRTVKGECYFCENERNTLSARQQAIAHGEKWYIPETTCKICNTQSPKHVDNGRCQNCGDLNGPKTSPRQIAISNGESWYTPVQPCPKCHTIADRRVTDGHCKGCVAPPTRDHRVTAESTMMKEFPDMILSRDDARGLGIKVYRTGGPCRRDHRGFRYTSTGNCIECLNG